MVLFFLAYMRVVCLCCVLCVSWRVMSEGRSPFLGKRQENVKTFPYLVLSFWRETRLTVSTCTFSTFRFDFPRKFMHAYQPYNIQNTQHTTQTHSTHNTRTHIQFEHMLWASWGLHAQPLAVLERIVNLTSHTRTTHTHTQTRPHTHARTHTHTHTHIHTTLFLSL
jgi:hypothetical protein